MHPLIKGWKSWNLRLPPLAKPELPLPSLFLFPGKEGAFRRPPGSSGQRDPSQAPGFRKLILSRLPGNCRQSAEQSDGDLLAGDALDKVLLPGVRVIPDPTAAAGHQALPAEAAAAASSARLPRSIPPLVNGPPEGKTEEGGKGGCWKTGGRRGDCFLPFLPSFYPAQTSLAQLVALHVFSFCSLPALQGKGNTLELNLGKESMV